MSDGIRGRKPHFGSAAWVKRYGPVDGPVDAAPTETEDQIWSRIENRFEVLDTIVQAAIDGEIRGAIVSGPPGLGKSYNVEAALRRWDIERKHHSIIKGHVKATGLLKKLWQHKDENEVIVFDDSDEIFKDEQTLNLLKTVCDTTESRRVSWLSEGTLFDEVTGENVPREFEFNGTIIFITNLDFDRIIEADGSMAPHMKALVSRSHYIDLSMKTVADYIVRIKQVVAAGLLNNSGLSQAAQDEVVQFVMDHRNNMRELSLRIVLKVAALRKIKPHGWLDMAKVTCCRNVA